MQPGVGYTFTNSGQGSNLNIEQPWSPVGLIGASAEEQFQIVVTPYIPEGGEGPPTQSLIRVVKGEVVWSPKLLLDPIPISSTCVAQTTITDWYGGIPYTVEVDDQDAYIGNGGLLLSNSAVSIGVFIFKATNMPDDYDPIIVATPDFTPSCPVVFPGTSPVDGAFWDVVKIGSVQYTAPDPEADPPVAGGWVITQKFIGSMTLPGDGKGNQEPVTSPQLPAQLVYNPGQINAIAPFECWIVNVNGERYLQIGKGTAAYSASNMPIIWDGAFTTSNQALFTSVQITSNDRVPFETIWPYGWPEDQPSYSINSVMEEGGGYLLYDTSAQLNLSAFKWDVDVGVSPFDANAVVNTGLPTLALISSSNTADSNKIAFNSGPSIYEQTMNIKPMTGYDKDSTDLEGDWGYCHTTWLNPRKIGFNQKTIASIVAESNSFSCFTSVERYAVPGVSNMIQHISLIGDVKSGGIAFKFGDNLPSVVLFPAVSTVAPGGYGSITSDELTLLACLNSIPPFIYDGETITLAGNVQVSKASAMSYFVTFVNELQGRDLPELTPITSAVVPYSYSFKVIQYHTGMLDLTTPMQMGMTQLMNKADQTEEDDPYNKNKDGDPEWKDIKNREDVINCNDFAGDVTTEGVYAMDVFAADNPDFTIADSCGDSCDFPFQVHKSSTGVWTVCTGMVNNQIPSNNDAEFSLTDGFIYLEIPFDSTNKAFPEAGGVTIATGLVMPDSDKDFSYVAIAEIADDSSNQLVTGSLWGDRIQVGAGATENAYYYYAQV